MNANSYTGIYETASNKNRYQVQIVAGKRHLLGKAPTVGEALEIYNNAAFYLSLGHWGFRIPLQGSEELQDRYNPDKRGHALMPEALESTLVAQSWCEENVTKLTTAPDYKAPAVVVQCLRNLHTRNRAFAKLVEEHYDETEREMKRLQSFTDPVVNYYLQKIEQLREDKAKEPKFAEMCDTQIESYYKECLEKTGVDIRPS